MLYLKLYIVTNKKFSSNRHLLK